MKTSSFFGAGSRRDLAGDVLVLEPELHVAREDINSAAFKVIVGPAKYTKGRVPMGTIVDVADNGAQVEIKGGSTALESSYQLRLQTYRALKTGSALTIRTTRPVNPTFSAWLERWGASVESASTPPGMH